MNHSTSVNASQRVQRFVSRHLRVVLAFVFVLSTVATVMACQVPVFRYALERWSADRYRITVLHDKPLNDELKTALKSLKQHTELQPGQPATIDLEVLDVNSDRNKLDPLLTKLWKERTNESEPLLLAWYPKANNVGRDLPAWSGTFSTQNVNQLLNSPVRKKLTGELQKGNSAVWVFVPSGREKADRAAKARLEKQLLEDSDWLRVPSAKEMEVPESVLKNVKIPLQIKFSIVELKRDDPAEQFLLASLLHSEDDLTTFDNQPLAFPVFGRGRVLYALVGRGIASDTIRAASAFMAGPCSCQVKNQNPGFDLLLQSNWKKALGDVLVSEPVDRVDVEANAPKILTIPPGRKSKK